MGAAGWREEPLQEPELLVSAGREAGPELEAGGVAGERGGERPCRCGWPEDAPSERARAAVRGESGAGRGGAWTGRGLRAEGAGPAGGAGGWGGAEPGREPEPGPRGAEGAGVRVPARALAL